MKEIESEKDAIFGQSSSPDDALSNSHDITQLAKAYNDQLSETTTHPHQSTSSDQSPAEEPPTTGDLWDAETREDAYEEREALFQFSQEEKNAWSNNGGMKQINSSHIHMLRHLIKEGPPDKHKEQEQQQQVSNTTSASESTNQPFSHLNHQGDGVSMVDVGQKQVTRRIATATSAVIFPPEVLSAFQLRTTQDKGQRSSEMIGPKGPIFETAKIAGIMAAKKTSDLIPLCHPLPLDRVNIDIQLIDNKAIIECECRVTHKTGVEMEALMGASVAALTIYDMVKAVSHRVEIGSTVLVGKSGGKSDFRAN
jgi:cyclic pyranopterin phosphate synthase